ncbi:DsbA family protein [Streptomyces sp. MI02-7b]|uniref:DsbA family protein n=1 Tax=Streptomyces sp. MI02-7b TaxID=462941 RepID=UPI0029BE62D4|nr:thioredoxin domain-containing protein [Streptomyces sp. MI02-7b]MDX3074301.1 thioredoxin domain-containing protein [Streptomyces sp. MI02-7b]
MSEKNREGKRSARERLQEQRVQDQRRQKRKRTAIVAGSVVGVLVIGAVIGILVANSGGDSEGAAAVSPAGATGENKLVIPTGASDAPSTLTVYEDFRCPACGAFEQGYRDTIHALEDKGQLKVDYHLVRIIDGNLGGTGSLNAANAAACAQDQNKFRDYHDVLYRNQPPEQDDKFASKPYLLQLAGQVPGLTTPAFTACVNKGTYDDWVNKNNSAFNSSGYNSTPTVLLNGKNIYGAQAAPLTPQKLQQMVTDANKGKKAGTATPSVTPPSAPASGSAAASASASASAPASSAPASAPASPPATPSASG